MIKVLFFAQLREQLGSSGVQISIENATNVNAIRAQLLDLYPDWQAFFGPTLRAAVNQTLVKGDHPVFDGDEVAFFPPVTGG